MNKNIYNNIVLCYQGGLQNNLMHKSPQKMLKDLIVAPVL